MSVDQHLFLLCEIVVVVLMLLIGVVIVGGGVLNE